jgi:hypothetical protein
MAQRLIALAVWCLVGAAAGCGSAQPSDDVPPATTPIPTAGLSGQPVTVYPLTLILAEASLGWDEFVTPRRMALDIADSLIAQALVARTPEVSWVLPEALRRAAHQAPGLLPDPDQIGTALLRRSGMSRIPDPLRSQLRSLTAVPGDRFALIPASLLFFDEANGSGRAELTVVLADVRLGRLGWRTVARAIARDPWAAVKEALESLTPLAQ